jgi:hypothetical protein
MCETRSLDTTQLSIEIEDAGEVLDYCIQDNIEDITKHPAFKSVEYHLRQALQLIEDSNDKR